MKRSVVGMVIGGLIVAGSLSAFEVEAVIRKVDGDQGLVVFRTEGRDRTVKVAKDAKFLDAAGKELAGGLTARELKEGAAVTLTIQREGDKPVIRGIKLGSKPAAPAKAPEPAPKADTSTLVPLTDLGKNEYKGFRGGLYPDGKNERPSGHEAAGRKLARTIEPLDADGKPNPQGKIVLLGIGFSNTLQSFQGFMRAAEGDREINPHVVLVNGAVGGVPASVAQHEDGEIAGKRYWPMVRERLKAAGVTPSQVQVVWIKETNPAPHADGFPKYTQDLQGQLTKIVQLLPKRFPRVKLVYLSSRTFGGWARRPGGGTPGNSEPYSYETGFAVKWLIEQQLQGSPELNFDPAKGPVKAPWLSWGPYLWANGATKRSDGFHFQLTDFRDNDRMHHSEAGMKKIGEQLLHFFKTDVTTREWFLAKGR